MQAQTVGGFAHIATSAANGLLDVLRLELIGGLGQWQFGRDGGRRVARRREAESQVFSLDLVGRRYPN